MPGLKERAKTLVELADGAAFLFAERPLAIDEKAAALLGEPPRAILRGALRGAEGRRGRLDCRRRRKPRSATSRQRNGLKLGASRSRCARR